MTKDEKQAHVVEKIIQFKGRGYLNHVGGSGKTVTSIKFIKKVQELRPNYTVTIVVPETGLKYQWEEELTKFSVTNCNVVVVNGVAIKNEPFNTHITIIDEGHLFLKGKVFSRIYQLSNGPYCIALSGTWSKDDEIILKNIGLPLIDKIDEHEALANGWISKSVEYNLGIELSGQEREWYTLTNQRVDEYFSTFGHDFKDAMSCVTQGGSLNYVRKNNVYKSGATEYTLATELSKKSNLWLEFTKQRTTFIQNHLGKLEVVAGILNSIPDRKFITFGALIDSAEKLSTLVFNSKTYHSKLCAIYIKKDDALKYGFKTKKNEALVKLSKDNVRRFYIEQLSNSEIRGIHTVKAADLGLDVKGVNCSVVYGRNSKAEKNDQRKWRSTRYEGDSKLSLLVNVYLKDTQDYRWLQSCQKGKRGIINVNSVEELVKDFNKRL